MNHNDLAIEQTDRVLNVEIWIDDADTDEAADITVDQARDVLDSAGVRVLGMPRRTSFDGCYHIDVTREWWNEMVSSGDDLDVVVHPGLHVHLALV